MSKDLVFSGDQINAIRNKLTKDEEIVEVVPAFTIRAFYARYGDVPWRDAAPFLWNQGTSMPSDTLQYDFDHFALTLTNKRLLHFRFQLFANISKPPVIKEATFFKQLIAENVSAYKEASGRNGYNMIYASDEIVSETEIARTIRSKSLAQTSVPDGALVNSGFQFTELQAGFFDHNMARDAINERFMGFQYWELLISGEDRVALTPFYSPSPRVEKLYDQIVTGSLVGSIDSHYKADSSNENSVDVSSESESNALVVGGYKIKPDADLRGAKLSGAFLRDANLSGVDLTGADLTNADLTGANLTGANLTYADLGGADLPGAIFVAANMTGASLTCVDFRGAIVRGANMSGVNFTYTDLSYTDLTQANLSGAKMPDGTIHD